jgi:hypothetical protein
MHISSQLLLLGVAAVNASLVKPRGTSTTPGSFQTSYGPFAGIYPLTLIPNASLKC